MNSLILVSFILTILWALACFLIATLQRTIYRPLKADENPSRSRPYEEVKQWRVDNGRKWIKRFFIVTGLGWALVIGSLFIVPVMARGLAPTVTPTPTASATATLTPTAAPTQTSRPQPVSLTPVQNPATGETIYPSPTGFPTSRGSTVQVTRVVQVQVTRIVSIQVTRLIQVQVTRLVVVTTTPGPTQTPWIIEVTAGPPTETPTPSETPTETPSPTPTEMASLTPTETASPTLSETPTP